MPQGFAWPLRVEDAGAVKSTSQAEAGQLRWEGGAHNSHVHSRQRESSEDITCPEL